MDTFVLELGRREKRVCIMISLSRERRIEVMNSFVWELGEKRKECVFIMISLSLLGEEDRNDGFVCIGIGVEVKRGCLS